VNYDRLVIFGIESNCITKDSEVTPDKIYQLFVEVKSFLTKWYLKLHYLPISGHTTSELEVTHLLFFSTFAQTGQSKIDLTYMLDPKVIAIS